MENAFDTSKIPFKPIRGTEERIQNMGVVDGGLYFATDSRKTYLGTADGEKLLMGYDIGVFYGKKEIPADNSGNPLNPVVYFNLQEIEGNRLPLKDDLILNGDGCFYRVDTVVDANNVKTTRLTLQGSGGGGGGGGNTPVNNFNITISPNSYTFSTTADAMEIGFISYYNGADDNYLSRVEFFLGSVDIYTAEPFYTVDGPFEFNVAHRIDLIDYKHLFGETSKTITVAIYDKYGSDRSSEAKVQLITLALEQVSSTLLYTTNASLKYTCDLSGGTSNVTDKQLVFKLYKESTPDELDGNPIIKNLAVSDEGGILTDLNLSAKEHGVYILKVQACATIKGTTNVLYSNELTHKIANFTAGGEPLLMVLAPDKTEQYTNIDVNYLFVTDESGQSYTLDIKLNNQSYKQENIKSNTLGKLRHFINVIS